MKRGYLLYAVVLIILTACSSGRHAAYQSYPYQKVQTMTASWYGKDFHGKYTASGDVYDMYSLTAAHKTLPFGSKLLVTNMETGKSTTVVINDRGPFVGGRDLDLSYQAARNIDLIGPGTGKVKVEFLGLDERYSEKPEKLFEENGPYTVQCGSFSDHLNAIRQRTAIEIRLNENVIIREDWVGSKKLYRVWAGMYESKEKAASTAHTLAGQGYATLVTTYR